MFSQGTQHWFKWEPWLVSILQWPCVKLCVSFSPGPPDASIYVEPITEERAAKTLYRIELLRKVREQVLMCPQLHERLQLCRPSLYLPVWWECGKHDRDLLIGTAKHGLNRTDYYIMNDPQLSFLDAYRNYAQHKRTDTQAPGSLCCLYQSNSKLYESLTYTPVSRTSESLESEPENLMRMESRDDHLCLPEGGLPDITCENFVSKVQEVISLDHDENLLPESLENMIYGKTGLSQEPHSFQEAPTTNTQSRKNTITISASRNESCQPPGIEAEITSASSLMSSLEAGVAKMNIKNGKHLLVSISKEGEPCCSETGRRPETIGHREAKCLVSPTLDTGHESGFVDLCSLSVYDPKRNFSSDQQLIDLLENKSLESKLILNQSDEEEEENEDETLAIVASATEKPEVLDFPKPTVNIPRGKNLSFHQDEAKKGRLEVVSKTAGPQRVFPPPANQCHCKHIERWAHGLGSEDSEVEKPKAYQPDLYRSKANNSTVEGETAVIPTEPFKLKHELLKEPWKESSEGGKSFSMYAPEGSEPKPEDMDFENKDDYEKDGTCLSQGTVCITMYACDGKRGAVGATIDSFNS